MKIIRDTREKVGYWDFSFFGYDEQVSKLDTGDYSISGLEDILCIERKKSVFEIANNIGKDNIRFESELNRMKNFKYKYIILEFSVTDLLSNLVIPNIKTKAGKSIKVRGQFIMKKLKDYENEYEVEIIFAGSKDNAIQVAIEIFKEVINEENS